MEKKEGLRMVVRPKLWTLDFGSGQYAKASRQRRSTDFCEARRGVPRPELPVAYVRRWPRRTQGTVGPTARAPRGRRASCHGSSRCGRWAPAVSRGHWPLTAKDNYSTRK